MWRRIHTQPLTEVPHAQAPMLVAGARTSPGWICAHDDLFAFICGLLQISQLTCACTGAHTQCPPPQVPSPMKACTPLTKD